MQLALNLTAMCFVDTCNYRSTNKTMHNRLTLQSEDVNIIYMYIRDPEYLGYFTLKYFSPSILTTSLPCQMNQRFSIKASLHAHHKILLCLLIGSMKRIIEKLMHIHY